MRELPRFFNIKGYGLKDIYLHDNQKNETSSLYLWKII